MCVKYKFEWGEPPACKCLWNSAYTRIHTKTHIYICQWQPQIKGQLNTNVCNGNRFSLVVIVSFNMILIIAQKYATVFALPNFVVDLSCIALGGGRVKEGEGAAVVEIQCQ